MNSKQLKVGNESEEIVGQFFNKNKYFVYITPKKIGGQPADIIAINKNKTWLVDAKHVRKEECSFTFSRIEANQKMSMKFIHDFAGIENTGFAIYFERDSNIYYLSYLKWLEMDTKGFKSVNMKELPLLKDIING